MKVFWKIIGKIYVFFYPKRKILLAILIIALIALQFVLLGIMFYRVNQTQKAVSSLQSNVKSSMNRVSSQLYQLSAQIGKPAVNKATTTPKVEIKKPTTPTP